MLLLLILAGAGAKIAYTLTPSRIAEAQAEALPVAAAEHLRESDPPRELFNTYNWGGYLLWAVPDLPVYVDGRTDLYGDDFLQAYLDAYTAGDDWQATFEQHDISLVVVEADSPLDDELSEAAGWSLDYEDEQAVIYVRETSMTLQEQFMTVDQFEAFTELPENAEKLFEFVGGEVMEVPSNPYVSKIASLFNLYIGMYLLEHDLGHLTGEQGGYEVFGDRYAPDVAFISYERQPELAKSGYNPNPPELAVEVVSSESKPRTKS